MNKGRILIVDDDKSSRELLSDLLTDENYKSLVAGSGEEGLNALHNGSCDLVLLDMVLHGLAGEEIPIGARIIAVVDAYDAMTTDRIYRKAPGHEHAVKELKRYAGSQFDPHVAEAFLSTLMDEERVQAGDKEN